VSGEAILAAEHSVKLLGSQGSALNPLGELTFYSTPSEP